MDNFRILIVDDEDDFREAIIKRLRARQMDVKGADSGSKALEMLDARDFDVVVLDVKMPGLDGIETLRQIKNKKPQVEVIMLTGYASVESGLQAMQAGAFDYLMKPMILDDLVDKLRQANERRLLQLDPAS